MDDFEHTGGGEIDESSPSIPHTIRVMNGTNITYKGSRAHTVDNNRWSFI